MNSQQLISALKRELKARDLTYAALANRVNMSKASIERMLTKGAQTLHLGLRPWMPPFLCELRQHPSQTKEAAV